MTQVSAKIRTSDPVANVDIELSHNHLPLVAKKGVDSVIASLGGIDTAFYLVGSVGLKPPSPTFLLSLLYILTFFF